MTAPTAYTRLKSIIYRCDDSDNKYYGGRGITCCQDWKDSPEEFVVHLLGWGDVRQKTVGRIDNDGDYEPGNVGLFTMSDQAINRSCNRGEENMRNVYKEGRKYRVRIRKMGIPEISKLFDCLACAIEFRNAQFEKLKRPFIRTENVSKHTCGRP